MARAASPSSHAPPSPVADRRRRAVRGPPGPVLRDPRVLQRRPGVPVGELGEGDVDQGLDRLPGPLREQARGQQPAHRLFQRVVVPLRPGPQVPAPRRGGQRVQHRLHHRGALRGQVPADDAGAVQRRLQRHAPVQVPAVLILRVRLRGPVPDLRADRGQRPQARPGPGRGHHDLLGLGPVVRRDGPGPLGQLQRDRLGQHVPLGQGGQQDRVVAGQRLDRLVLAGLPPGHPGAVHQPGPGGPLPVGQVPVLGVEDLQEAGRGPPPRSRRPAPAPAAAAPPPARPALPGPRRPATPSRSAGGPARRPRRPGPPPCS